MPSLDTTYFGKLDFTPEDVFAFPAGIPGFEEHTEFVLVRRAEMCPLVFMQSVCDGALSFIAAPLSVAAPDYRLELCPEDRALLEVPPGAVLRGKSDLACLALVTASAGEEPTVNLASPIVLNLKNRRGVQAVRSDSKYSLRCPLAPLTEAASCS